MEAFEASHLQGPVSKTILMSHSSLPLIFLHIFVSSTDGLEHSLVAAAAASAATAMHLARESINNYSIPKDSVSLTREHVLADASFLGL